MHINYIVNYMRRMEKRGQNSDEGSHSSELFFPFKLDVKFFDRSLVIDVRENYETLSDILWSRRKV